MPKQYICKQIKGQKAIHVGAVGQKGRLKRHISFKEVCPDIVAFDISKKDVEIAHKMGYPEIFVADATNKTHMKAIVEEHGTFPHVLMPEVIEHVPNLGLLLEGMKILMSKKGRLYITTPYMWGVKPKVRPSKHHICWFCEHTISKLLRTYGFSIEVSKIFVASMLVIARK